jgi:hypothetical protein
LLLDVLGFGRVAAIPKSAQMLPTTKHAERNLISDSAPIEEASVSVDKSIEDSQSQDKA